MIPASDTVFVELPLPGNGALDVLIEDRIEGKALVIAGQADDLLTFTEVIADAVRNVGG